MDRGLDKVRAEPETIRDDVKEIEEVVATLEPGEEACADLQEKFEELIDRFKRKKDPIHQQIVQVMMSFLAGLFVGEDKLEQIRDNLDLERWFRLPKSHERRIHGHCPAGWCTLWTRTLRILSHSPQKTCYRTGQPESHRAKNRH